MAIRNIVDYKDPILKKKCREVTRFDEKLWVVLDDMRETLVKADGAGLAAPQIGLLRRIFIMNIDGKDYEIINPEIVETSGEQDGLEGCLSFPGQYALVKRPMYAKVKGKDRHGKDIVIEGEGLIARCICHESDHLDGIVYKERAYKQLTQEELEEYIEKNSKDDIID